MSNPNPTPQTCYGRDRRQPAPVDLSDVPTRFCNTSQPRDSYRPPAWNVRDGANDHKQFKSGGQ